MATDGLIAVRLNGEPARATATLASALSDWGYEANEIAVAINGDVVPRGEYATRRLNDDDDVEVLTPIQGG